MVEFEDGKFGGGRKNLAKTAKEALVKLDSMKPTPDSFVRTITFNNLFKGKNGEIQVGIITVAMDDFTPVLLKNSLILNHKYRQDIGYKIESACIGGVLEAFWGRGWEKDTIDTTRPSGRQTPHGDMR